MKIFEKTVISINPPNNHNVLWVNPNTNQVLVWLDESWQSLSNSLSEYKQNKYDVKLDTKNKSIVGAINELFSMVNGMDITIDLTPVAKEDTLISKVTELKEALNSIDFTAIQQAIQGVEDVTAREATLIQGVEQIIKAVENINFSTLAKESTLTQVASKVEEEADSIEAKIDEIVTAYNNGQEIIDQMVAIQLETIIGKDENN